MCDCLTCITRRERGLLPFYAGPGCKLPGYKLTVEPKPWDWDPSVCPADQHFIEYVQDTHQPSVNIFHMGSGNHHMVGRKLAPYHTVTAITHSPDEMHTYVRMAVDLPDLAYWYKCMFGDIFQLRLTQLPRQYDLVTLFHIGELASGDYKHHTFDDLILMFREITNCVVFYRDSFAYNDIVKPLVDKYFKLKHSYKSLEVCCFSAMTE